MSLFCAVQGFEERHWILQASVIWLQLEVAVLRQPFIARSHTDAGLVPRRVHAMD